MSGVLRAVAVTAPIGAPTTTAFTSTSTAAIDLGNGTVRVIMQATEACYIRFGESDVGAALTSDWPINADVPYVFDINPGNRYFRVIRASTDGNLVWALCA